MIGMEIEDGASGEEPFCLGRRYKRLRIQFLGREDPLEEGMATPTPVFLPGESPGQRSQRATVHRVTENWIY